MTKHLTKTDWCRPNPCSVVAVVLRVSSKEEISLVTRVRQRRIMDVRSNQQRTVDAVGH